MTMSYALESSAAPSKIVLRGADRHAQHHSCPFIVALTVVPLAWIATGLQRILRPRSVLSISQRYPRCGRMALQGSPM